METTTPKLLAPGAVAAGAHVCYVHDMMKGSGVTAFSQACLDLSSGGLDCSQMVQFSDASKTAEHHLSGRSMTWKRSTETDGLRGLIAEHQSS